MAVQTANGSTYVMGLYGCTYNTEVNEVDAAQSVVDVWEDFFGSYAAYTCNDSFGSGTQKQTVLDNADEFEDDYDHVTMFHYGHAGMNGVFRDYFDNDGWNNNDDCIWDYEVYSETSSSKHFFVVLWSCRQGDYIGGTYMGTPYGMPYAWFHGAPSSGDCFIGFEDASMPLTQISAHNANVDYEPWLMSVGMRLSYSHYTVIQALNAASQYYFSLDYVQTELDDGYTAYWDYGTWDGKMKIYGNWNIQVY